MRVHHINTGTMCPLGGRLVNGQGGLFERARLVCHCLLIESDEGLVLVDTGIGLDDIADPTRLGSRWVRQTTPRLDPAETALQQVKAMGFSPGEVRHILLTHLDRDHAGGIGDFPRAKVHVHRSEHAMAVEGRPAAPRGRYVADQWRHRPDWQFYDDSGEDWFGFSGVRAPVGRSGDIVIVPLPGHTPGHCGVAVRQKDKWLLHAGDAYFFHGQLEARPRMPLLLGLFQRKGDLDRATRIVNQERLRRLKCDHGDQVTIVNSHDPAGYERCRCGEWGGERAAMASPLIPAG